MDTYWAWEYGTGAKKNVIELVRAADAQRALDAERAELAKVRKELADWQVECKHVGHDLDAERETRENLEHQIAARGGLAEIDDARAKAGLHDALQTQLSQIQAQLARLEEEYAEKCIAKDNYITTLIEAKNKAQAQLRQVEGERDKLRSELNEYTGITLKELTSLLTLRQLVEALINSDTAKDHDKAWFALRATLAAQDAGAKLPAWVNEAMRLAPTQTNPPHPTEERYE